MTPLQKNLAASSILLLLFGRASHHLAAEKKSLETRLQNLATSSVGSTSTSSRQVRSHERTVGDLLQEYSGPFTAKELIQRLSLTESEDSRESWKISAIYLSQLTLPELLKLEADLGNTDGPTLARNQLFNSIQSLLRPHYKDRPSDYFDHLIGTSRIHYHSSAESLFAEWVGKSPHDAVTWFLSKDPKIDFRNGHSGSLYNREVLRYILLSTLAGDDLKTAMSLIREENKLGKTFSIPMILGSRVIEEAISTGDDLSLVDFLRSNRDSPIPKYDDQPFGENSFWEAFTTATNDPDRSIRLLQSLEKPNDYGKAVAQISRCQTGKSLPEKAAWLRSIVDEESEQALGLMVLLTDPIRGTLSEEASEWLDQQPASPKDDQIFVKVASHLSSIAEEIKAFEMANRLAPSPEREELIHKLANLIRRSYPDSASEILPPELLEKVSKDSE